MSSNVVDQSIEHCHHSLAFSNPVYGQIECAQPSMEHKPNQFVPVPKPRKIRSKNVCPPLQSVESSDQRHPIKKPNDNQFNVSTTTHNHSDRLLQCSRESVRMTVLLDEMISLADSFGCANTKLDSIQMSSSVSGSTVSTEPDKVTTSATPSTTIRRKLISVPSGLLNMSFGTDSTDENDANNDSLDIDEVLSKVGLFTDTKLEVDQSLDVHSFDSGMFSTKTSDHSCLNTLDDESTVDEHCNHALIKEQCQTDSESNLSSSTSGGSQCESDSKVECSISPPPPKLPPRKAFRLDIAPQSVPVLNAEQLCLEHLHQRTLSLQRSGYLWKTGPNYKCFKYRWCILYRHSTNIEDANFSYYFNRSSMSASLSGKILLNELEFVATVECISAKARLPKVEKCKSTDSSLAFFEVGVQSRNGRVYLFAARTPTDRQQWMHALVQSVTLHAFKHKELYHFGFVRAKFTITTRWQQCFAVLTADRYLYVFELSNETSSQDRAKRLNCKLYQVFNLRQTVRIARLEEEKCCGKSVPVSVPVGHLTSSQCGCKHGFSLTQTGGHVLYLTSDFESHTSLWYRSVIKHWNIVKDPPDRVVLEEQYLTKDSVTVAIDKCLKFLDTFNSFGVDIFSPATLTGANQTANPFQVTSVQSVGKCASKPMPTNLNLTLLNDLLFHTWNVHFLPQKHTANEISLSLLHYLRSMNECIFTERLLPYWLQVGSAIETSQRDGTDSNDEDCGQYEQLKQLLKLLPLVNYATLRRIVIYLFNLTNGRNVLSAPLCKALLFSRSQATVATVPLSTANTILNALIKHHLWLFEVTKEEVDKEMRIKRVVHLIKSQNIIEQNKSGRKHSASIKANSPPCSSASGRLPSPKKLVSSLIIGIKVCLSAQSTPTTTVNVHLNKDTSASDVIDMVFEKIKLTNTEDQICFSLFEILCYRRLERVILDKEHILPVVLHWSSWPSHWSAGACLEVKHTDRLLKSSDTNKPMSPSIATSSSTSWSKNGSFSRTGHDTFAVSASTVSAGSISLVDLGRNKTDSLHYSSMLMSVIRYCGQNDTRLTKKVLAEFSLAQLFLYCKESHQLIGQFQLKDLYWYVGLESGAILHYTSTKCSSTVTNGASFVTTDQPLNPCASSTGDCEAANVVTSMASASSSSTSFSTSEKRLNYDLSVPALTFVERDQIEINQSKRRVNFGHTLVFCTWSECHQWIRALYESSLHKDLYQ